MRILILTVCYALEHNCICRYSNTPTRQLLLVIRIQTNLVTYVKQLVSCKWLSHDITKPPMPADIVHLGGANFLLLALCGYTFPSAFCFSLNTHLQSIAFFPTGRLYSIQV